MVTYLSPMAVPCAGIVAVNHLSLEEYVPQPPKCISVNMKYSKGMRLPENGLAAVRLHATDTPCLS